jgi:hypothetical protein
MLASPKSRKVLEKVLNTALEDGHPHQGMCMKLVMDRIIPQGAMAQQAGAGEEKRSIRIEITGLQASVSEQETIDGDWEDVSGQEDEK